MTILRQVTIRPLLWMILACAVGSAQNAVGQTRPESNRDSFLEIPFSWTIDAPQPIDGIYLPEKYVSPTLAPAAVVLPSEPASPLPTGIPAAEPALIESHSNVSFSPSPKRSLTPARAASISRPGMRPVPVTVGEMPASLNRSAATNPLSPMRAVAAKDPVANPVVRQPTVVLAKSDSVLLLPEQVSIEIDQASSPVGNALTTNQLGSPLATSNGRPMILFQPAVPTWDPAVGAILKPTVHLADQAGAEILPTPSNLFSGILPAITSDEDRIPIPDNFQPDAVWVPSDASRRLETFRQQRRKPFLELYRGLTRAMKSQAGRDVGVGIERLPFALFEIDAAKPSNNVRFRFESARDWEFVDRVEYFWSRIGKKGPKFDNSLTFEPSLDYQDMRLSFEVGGEKFSATTEIPLRFIDPTNLGNTGGMGDMVVTTKTVMIDGDSLRLTQVLRNQMPTGSAKRGLGNGHVSMEPGFVAAYKWNERTLIHNELKLWFPLGGEPGFSGPVLRYGFGFANVLYDSDTFAVIPTFELVGWSILSGQKSVGLPNPQSIDGENIINLYPGLRIVRDSGRLFELGISGGTTVTERHWYRSVMRLDLRWTF